MSQPLGRYVGNGLEVYECIKVLRGEADEAMRPTLDLSVELTAHMLIQSRVTSSMPGARAMIDAALGSGRALEKFKQNIQLQDGDPRVCDKPEILLKKGLSAVPVLSEHNGYVSAIETFELGRSICDIGGGRIRAEDKVDHAVGYECIKKIGDRVQKGDTLGIIHCRRPAQADLINEKLKNAYKIGRDVPRTTELIRATV
jgi:thymidine phosphorylase